MRKKGSTEGFRTPFSVIVSCVIFSFACATFAPEPTIEVSTPSVELTPEQLVFLTEDGYLRPGAEDTDAYKQWMIAHHTWHERDVVRNMLRQGTSYPDALTRIKVMAQR